MNTEDQMTLAMDDQRAPALAQAPGSVSDPVCGHCGRRLSKHYHENEIYCFETTTGDIFTDEPSADHLGSFVEHRYPELHARFVKEWQAENGHSQNAEVCDESPSQASATEKPRTGSRSQH